jgi:hypothetical protein
MANVGKKGQAIKKARSQTGDQRAAVYVLAMVPVDSMEPLENCFHVGINANHRQH